LKYKEWTLPTHGCSYGVFDTSYWYHDVAPWPHYCTGCVNVELPGLCEGDLGWHIPVGLLEGRPNAGASIGEGLPGDSETADLGNHEHAIRRHGGRDLERKSPTGGHAEHVARAYEVGVGINSPFERNTSGGEDPFRSLLTGLLCHERLLLGCRKLLRRGGLRLRGKRSCDEQKREQAA
jgi:hypothetical protein